MEPMDYIASNGHHRPNSHYDPVHSASTYWASHSQSQNPGPYPWQAQTPSLPHIYSHSHQVGLPPPSSGPDPYSHHAAMLPPLQGLPPSGPFSGSMHGPISPRLGGHPQSYRSSMPLAVPPVPASIGNHSHDAAFANQIPGGTHMDWQSPMPGPEANSMHRPNYAYPDSGANFAHSYSNQYFSNFAPAPQPPLPYYPVSTRRSHFSTASIATRGFGGIPSPNRPAPPSTGYRRSHPRPRRSTSSRPMATEVGREDEDEGYYGPPDYVLHSPGGSDSSQESDEVFIRQMQIARGSVSTKMVASKMTLRSLQSVELEELPEADRSCVICYNEYCVETPEGVKEAPLRLPKCGHIFGDHCIKKWFEDSDSCPYCRDKLHAEPKTQGGSSARAFMNLMRSRGINPGLAAQQLPDEVLAHLRAHPTGADRRNGSPPHALTAARRSPPREGVEHQHRRTRARHDNSSTHNALPIPESRNRAVSTETPRQPTVLAVELPSIRPQPEQLPVERQPQEWGLGHAQDVNVVSTSAQDRSVETQLPPAVLPELSPYPSQDAQDQRPRARTLRNPLQVQTGSPYEGLGNNETAPDMPYHSNQRW